MHLQTVRVQLQYPRCKSELEDPNTDLSRGSGAPQEPTTVASFKQRNEEIKAELMRARENMALMSLGRRRGSEYARTGEDLISL
jgi:hypothetical protein